ncbi:ATP synthase subunit C lysine N-methyltransferase isoform X1 [Homo sapiens]|uniref:ATP synthase subunit C lysine N-methyltransferase isoform X1 n=1 Tax=Homo sapiens TaxID=9606 RepID=UPI001FB1867B|nr:ATP synthase subunit C lysine N-methyltransferase isoform X1 [Homo sapiens]XP_054207586.1 ATP synthase subunit C lysine N-methyltransferase isoform X1 [Homo sapiens]
MEGGGGIPLETLKEESQSRHVLPASFEVNSLQKSNWGFLLTGLVGGTLVAVYAVATPFVTPALRKVCLPFVPATTKQIENVVKMLRCRRGSLVDIGSGDGRIVIAAAKKGFTAVGYELNPWLVWYSRYRAWREGYFFAVLERCYFRCASDAVTLHRCCSWRRNLNVNLRMMHELLLAGSLSHIGLQTTSRGRG